MATVSPVLISRSIPDKISSVPAEVSTRMPKSRATHMLSFVESIMKLRRTFIALLIFLGVAPPLPADTILIVGDSLSAAYGMPIEQGWVALLNRRMAREGLPHKVVNASISGDTTAAAAARLPRAFTANTPDIVVLQIGGNDGLRGLPVAQMKQNLVTMVQYATSHHAKVLLIGVQLPPNYGPRYTEKFQSVYRDVAQHDGVTLVPSLVDGVGTRPDLMQADGLHPNADAQPLILEMVWPKLRSLL